MVGEGGGLPPADSRSGGFSSTAASANANKNNRFRVFFDTLKSADTVVSGGAASSGSSGSNKGARRGSAAARGSAAGDARSVRLFALTPGERQVDVISRKTGRAMTELEVLQEKHQPEFRLLVPFVADALTRVLARNAELARTVGGSNSSSGGRYAVYETNDVPGICMEDYVARFADYTYISPSTLLAALIFLDRLASRHPTLLFTPLNVYKLFFVAVRVASKVVDLRTLSNKNFAHVGGISNRHLNELEAQFLIDIRFDLYLTPGEFHSYADRIMPAA